jgi:hypothetical protein
MQSFAQMARGACFKRTQLCKVLVNVSEFICSLQ